MKKLNLLFLTFFLTLLNSNYFSQEDVLPKHMTDDEKIMMDAYLSPFDGKGISSPPPYDNIRTAAEWEEVQALVITWTNQFNSIHRQIVDAAQEECTVIIHCSDSNQVKSLSLIHI